jgi:para-nitrobenzyl esterase
MKRPFIRVRRNGLCQRTRCIRRKILRSGRIYKEEKLMVRTIFTVLTHAGVAAATLLFNASAASPGDTILAIDAGKIRGVIETPGSPVRVFRGIPYARPPVGELRWKPPQPVVSWDTLKECSTFGPSCLQPAQKIIPGITGKQSEDCLYLNVWTAANPGDKRPVLVWIHGGGFTIGSGSQRTYDGLHFAEDGAVEVTINYRLGPFGFMAHPRSARNLLTMCQGTTDCWTRSRP